MNELMDQILSYMKFLEQTLHLSVSVHFSNAKLRVFPNDLFSMLLPYNIHKNPYCTAVKKDHWAECICVQQNILRENTRGQHFCQTCYAGVKEYIYQIREGSEIVGYIAVSGYRGAAPALEWTNKEMWESCLACEEMPEELLGAVVPPLCRMFELLFRFPMTEDDQGEYHLILQYLHDRHGQVTLDELCEHFGRSKSYISHLFNEKCEISLPAYCNTLKLNYAKTLLDRVQIPITEIALDVGYNDASYFILRFKERFGITPLQYRKMIVSDLSNRK